MQISLVKIIKEKISSDLGKDIVITLVSQLGIMLLALFVNKLLSNMLGVERYGQYSIIKKSTSVLSFIMLAGMGIALPRYLSEYMARKEIKKAKSTVMASLLLMAIIISIIITICVLMIKKMSPFIVVNNDVALYYTAILFAISTTFSSILFAYYRGTNAFINFAVSQITIQVIITICTILFGSNLMLVLNLWAITTIIYILSAIIIESKKNKLYKKNPIQWKVNILPQLKTLYNYGIPRMIGDIFLFSFAAFPLVYINQKIGIRQSSFFATGITLTAIITPFFSFLGMVLLPYVSTSIAQNNFKQADKLIKQLTLLYIVLSIIVTIILWIGMDIFIELFFNVEFLPATYISKILVLSILFESIYLLLRNPIDAVSHFPYNTINLLLSFIVLIALFYFSKTIVQFAVSFLLATIVKSIISFFTWHFCRKEHAFI